MLESNWNCTPKLEHFLTLKIEKSGEFIFFCYNPQVQQARQRSFSGNLLAMLILSNCSQTKFVVLRSYAIFRLTDFFTLLTFRPHKQDGQRSEGIKFSQSLNSLLRMQFNQKCFETLSWCEGCFLILKVWRSITPPPTTTHTVILPPATCRFGSPLISSPPNSTPSIASCSPPPVVRSTIAWVTSIFSLSGELFSFAWLSI